VNLPLFLGVFGLIVSVTALVRSVKHPPPMESAPLLSTGAPVLLLGDSIGVGIDAPLRALLLPAGHELISSVESGRSIRAQNGHGLPAVPEGTRVALLSLGSNDTNNPDAEESDLRALAAKLEKLEIRPYWILPPSFAKGTAAQKRVINLFDRVGIPMLPVTKLPSVDSDPLGVHPTPTGYKEFAADIAATLIGAP